jgi:hypothetical protein
VVSLLLGEGTSAARGDVHRTRMGADGGRRVGVRIVFGRDSCDPGILLILLSFSLGGGQSDAERDVFVEGVGNVTANQEVLHLAAEASAESGNLRLFIPIENRHVTNESSVVRSARSSALLHVEELVLSGGFRIRILERRPEASDEMGP